MIHNNAFKLQVSVQQGLKPSDVFQAIVAGKGAHECMSGFAARLWGMASRRPEVGAALLLRFCGSSRDMFFSVS